MVKTRFAPSPTGHLHVGGARTALFSYYFAKKHKGAFVLRIEDTDFARSKKEYEVEILKSLEWLGVHWDEKPYFQSQRQELYKSMAKKLLDSGNAYKCFLTSEELEKMRAEAVAKGEHLRIRSPWRDKTPGAEQEGKPYSLRFRYPVSGQTVVHDGVLGDVTFENTEGDDLIILRSDGTPTYQLSVVVDDLDMGITHVIRGDDHLNNTPKQLLMIQALGGKAPHYAHCPMILGPDKSKLSKRHGAVSVYMYAENYLPEALRNSLIRLGWSHGDQEIFTHEELCQLFDLDGCGKSAAVFDVQKLDWVNGEFIKRIPRSDFIKYLKDAVQEGTSKELRELAFNKDQVDLLKSMLEIDRAKPLLEKIQESIHKLPDALPKLTWYLNLNKVDIDPDCDEKILKTTPKELIAAVVKEIESKSWNPDTVMEIFKSVATGLNLKMPQVAKPVRVLLTGTLQSPDMGIVCAALGKEKVLERLRQFTG